MMRRTALRSRPRNTGPSPETVQIVWDRDRGRCCVCGEFCMGARGWDFSVQHRLRRGSGGTERELVNLPGNLVLAHGSGTTSCHGRIEGNREWAREQGFRVVDGVGAPGRHADRARSSRAGAARRRRRLEVGVMADQALGLARCRRRCSTPSRTRIRTIDERVRFSKSDTSSRSRSSVRVSRAFTVWSAGSRSVMRADDSV